MKRFLSILLAVLMILGTMSTVALADSSYTLTTVATTLKAGIDASDFIKKDSKVRLKVDGLAEGDTVTYYNNGVEIPAASIVAEVDAEGVATGIVQVPADGFVNNYTAKISNGATTNAVTVKTETYEADNFIDFRGNQGTVSSLDFSDVSNFYTNRPWSALEDITIGGKSAKKLTGYLTTATKTLTNAIQISSHSFYVDSKVARDEDISLMSMNVYARATGCNESFWVNGVVDLNKDNTLGFNDPSHASAVNYKVTEDAWHTLTVVLNMNDRVEGQPTFDIYVDDVCMVSDTPLKIYKKDTHTHTGNCYITEANYNMHIAPCDGIYIADPAVETYKISSATVSMDALTVSEVPAGTKIFATASGLVAGQKIMFNKNGVWANGIATADGKYYTTIDEGWQSVYAAVCDSYNNALVETDEATYLGIALTKGASTTHITADDANEYEEGKLTAAKTGAANIFNTYVDNGNMVVEEENGNKYLSYRLWNNAAAKRDSSYVTDVASSAYVMIPATTSAYEVSMDYKVSEYWTSALKAGSDSEYEHTAKAIANTAEFANLYLVNNNYFMYHTQNIMRAYTQNNVEIPFFKVVNKGNKVLEAQVYQNGSVKTQTLPDINIAELHNYKAVVDLPNNNVWLYVDDVLVLSGNVYSSTLTDGVKGTYLSVLDMYGANYNPPAGGIEAYIDNVYAYPLTNQGASTDAFVNASANGIGVVTSNLTSAEKVSNLAIIADCGINGYQVQTFDATTASGYKTFNFKNAAERILVWDWSTLKPIRIPFTFGD